MNRDWHLKRFSLASKHAWHLRRDLCGTRWLPIAASAVFSAVFSCRIQLWLSTRTKQFGGTCRNYVWLLHRTQSQTSSCTFGFEHFWTYHFFLPKWSRTNMKCSSKETLSPDLFVLENPSSRSKDWFHTSRDTGSSNSNRSVVQALERRTNGQ